jgi:hypothetical protein
VSSPSSDEEAVVVALGSTEPVASGFLGGRCRGSAGHGRRRWREVGRRRLGMGTTALGTGRAGWAGDGRGQGQRCWRGP